MARAMPRGMPRHAPLATSLRASAMGIDTGIRTVTTSAEALGLNKLGIANSGVVHRNLSYDEIHAAEVANRAVEGTYKTANGTIGVDTGKFTGRSPSDKYFVRQSPSSDNIWWGKVNKPLEAAAFDELYALATAQMAKPDAAGKGDLYVFDGFCGANPASRKKVRFVTQMAWQHHFVTNMFIRPTPEELESFGEPDFTVINACRTDASGAGADGKALWKRLGLNSEVFVAFNVERNVAIIGGTFYGGEMKKGIFSMMNYWLPLEGTMAMHCSANKATGPDGDTCLFFGLSGTGKTTLSADPKRDLIGDDEHGWDDDGVFNFEGGCYAKTIDLSPATEPEIYAAIKRDALLENVTLVDAAADGSHDGTPDYSNTSKTENGRVSYPLHHIPNFEPTSRGGHPQNIIFLTADAYGVLPPVSKLTPEQAQYHFLSGYTAKVAGTERGITEPVATFSACFGAAFLPLHPTKYAELLQAKMEAHGTHAYLVNTGWTGGPYGVGKRFPIPVTRACIDAILDGSIRDSEFETDPIFNVAVPTALHGVPSELLKPRSTWADPAAFEAQARKLAGMFIDNFAKSGYGGPSVVAAGGTDYTQHGPRLD